MLPVGTSHAALARAITEFADLLSRLTRGPVPPYETQRRLSLASQITTLTREILTAELASVEADL